tara:strand:- start:3768 stop:5819 length:2052 start_codon:yes stop_codon:yes gene_type:complete
MAKTYVVKLEIDGVSESVSSINGLEKAVSKLEAELKSADLGSAEFKKLSSELGKAKNELGSFKTEINNLDPKKKAAEFDDFGKGVSNSFGIATQAMGLFGAEGQEIAGLITQAQEGIQTAYDVTAKAQSAFGKAAQDSGQSAVKSTKGLVGGFKNLVKGVKGGSKAMKIAIASTGIGLLVVAVGLLVAYWDDIKGLVSGVSGEQAKLNKEAEQNVKTQQEGLDAISAQEESLKLQGKSEKEIRDMKIAQTDEVIAATKLQLEQMEITKKAQVDAAERNRNIAQGIIAFLMAPVTILLAGVDALTSGLAYIGVLDEGTNLALELTESAANLIFDPKEIAAEGDAAIKETKNQLTKLENSRAGFINRANAEADSNNKAASDKREAEKQKAEDQEEKDAEEKKAKTIKEAEELRALNNELALLALDDEFARAKLALEQQEAADLLAIEGAENKGAQEHAIELKYTALQIALANTKLAADKVISDEAIALSDKEKEEKIANEQAVADFEKQLQASKIQTIANGFKLIADLAGESKAAQAIAIIGENAVGIANQIISTQASNIAITAQGTALAIPSGGSSVATAAALVTSNNISLGIGIAGSAAATAKALAALKEGGDTGGGASPGGGGGGSPNLGTPEQTSSIDFGFLGDGDVSQLGETAPVQAYVLGADVSSTLEANQVIKDQSTL